MLNFGNKEFRNLQEQVLFNANELQALKQLQLGGVKIINLIAHIEDLPVQATAGDAYLVGETRPYRLYVYIDGDYFDLGDFPQEGPQGIQGIQGIKGEIGQRGSKWSIGTTKPAGIYDDLHIDFNGDIYRFNGSDWQLFTNIRGPQGLQGPIGPAGPQGPQGIQGERGETGLAEPAVVIKGELTSINQLPSPSTVDRNSAYIINKDLYVIAGESVLLWVNVGLFIQGDVASSIGFQPTGNIASANVQSAIVELDNEKVAKTTTINTKPLSANITLTAEDIYFPDEEEMVSDTLNDLIYSKVDNWITINYKPLSANITLTSNDIDYPNGQETVSDALDGLFSLKVNKTTTINTYPLNNDVELWAEDIYSDRYNTDVDTAIYDLEGSIGTQLYQKADKSTTYTKNEVDNLIKPRYGYVKYQSASSWAKVLEVDVPADNTGRDSIVLLITSENASSTTSERYSGILELNTHENTASASLRWLVVSGYGLTNFNLRHYNGKYSLWFLPSIGTTSFQIIAETNNGQAVEMATLFTAEEGTTRDGLSLGTSDKATILNKSDLGLDLVDNTPDSEKIVHSLRETRANNQTLFWVGTQLEYDAIVNKNPVTLYFIK